MFREKVNMHLRESICLGLGDKVSCRAQNRIEMREIEKLCRLSQNPFENLDPKKFEQRKRITELHLSVLKVKL